MRKLTGITLLAVLLAHCGTESSAPIPSMLTIESSAGDLIDLQQTSQLTVIATDESGNQITIEDEPGWSVNNDHASVNGQGLLSPLSVGQSVVSVSVYNLNASISLTIWDETAPRTDIYVSDVGTDRNGPHKVIRYLENGQHPIDFISQNLSRPQDIVFLEEQGMVLVSNLGSNNITMHNSETGSFIGNFATGLAQPTRMDIGPDSLLYVLQWGSGKVVRYDPDGNLMGDFTDFTMTEAIGMDWDSSGNLYVSSWGNGTNGYVQKFDGQGGDLGKFIDSNLSGPTDIWFDGQGNLLVNDWSGNSVKRFDADGNFLGVFISGVSQPEGVAFPDNGNILIGASGSSSIRMFDSNGAFITNLIPNGRGGLITPNAVVLRKVNQ